MSSITSNMSPVYAVICPLEKRSPSCTKEENRKQKRGQRERQTLEKDRCFHLVKKKKKKKKKIAIQDQQQPQEKKET